MNVYLIADSFLEDFVGGQALNDEVLYEELNKLTPTKKVRCADLDENTLFEDGAFFIVSNFMTLPQQAREILKDRGNYIIVEHDYKFVRNRNPAQYPDFVVPADQFVSVDFYEGAKAIICQSAFHKGIFDKNLNMGDKTINLSGNLWSEFHLDLMRVLSKREKKDSTTLIYSPYYLKGNHLATQECLQKGWGYEYISNWQDYTSFLIELSKNKRFVFFPLTPETLSRTAIEAKMMNIEFVSNDFIGAAREAWFNLNGPDLVDIMVAKKAEITTIILDYANHDL